MNDMEFEIFEHPVKQKLFHREEILETYSKETIISIING